MIRYNHVNHRGKHRTLNLEAKDYQNNVRVSYTFAIKLEKPKIPNMRFKYERNFK